MATLKRIAKDHLAPAILYQIVDNNNCPVDLTNATSVTFSLLWQDRCATVKFAKQAAILSELSEFPKSKGWVIYDWSGDDTDTEGYFYGRFHVTEGGKESAFPNQLEKLEIYIERSGVVT